MVPRRRESEDAGMENAGKTRDTTLLYISFAPRVFPQDIKRYSVLRRLRSALREIRRRYSIILVHGLYRIYDK